MTSRSDSFWQKSVTFSSATLAPAATRTPVSVRRCSQTSESAMPLKARVTLWVSRSSTTSFSASDNISPAAPAAAWRRNSRRSIVSSVRADMGTLSLKPKRVSSACIWSNGSHAHWRMGTAASLR